MYRKILLISLFIFTVNGLSHLDAEREAKAHFPFDDEASLQEWKEHIFKNKVIYTITEEQGQKFVLAKSIDAASGLYYKVRYSAKSYPFISWKWRILEFPKKNTNTDDFAARVYIIFPSAIFFKSQCIEYVWDNKLEPGTIQSSSLHKNIKQMVIRKNSSKEWVVEERNVYEDFKKAFGEYPDKKVGAIAFMSDTDNDKGQAIANYDEIAAGYKNRRRHHE